MQVVQENSVWTANRLNRRNKILRWWILNNREKTHRDICKMIYGGKLSLQALVYRQISVGLGVHQVSSIEKKICRI